MVTITPLKIRDMIVPVDVDESGTFRATIHGNPYAEKSYEALRETLVLATRRKAAKVAVPFSILAWTSPRLGVPRQRVVRHGVATGVHATRGVVLIRWNDDGKADELLRGGGMGSGIVRPLDADEAGEYLALADAWDAADLALRNFRKAREMHDLRAAVRDAISKAVTAETAKEDVP